MEECAEVALLPVEAGGKREFAALHLNNYYYINIAAFFANQHLLSTIT